MPVVCGVGSCLMVAIALLMATIADANDAAGSGLRPRPTPAPRPTPLPPRASCPQYVITAGTPTIVPGISDTGNHCVWCETVIPLPFPFVLYNQTFTAVNVTSSGRLDFLCMNEPAGYTETCLPAPPNNCPYDYTIFRCGLSGPPMQTRPVAQRGQLDVAFSPRFQALRRTASLTSNGTS